MLACMVVWSLVLGAPAGSKDVVVLGPSPTDQGWYGVRAADVLAGQLRLVGFRVSRNPTAPARRLQVSVHPSTVKARKDRVKVRVTSDGQAWEVRGQASQLDLLIARLVAQIAPWGGAPWNSVHTDLLPVWTDPFAIHRYLGRAEVRRQRGEYQQAALMFGRAQETLKQGALPEAIRGRRRAEAGLARVQTRRSSRKGLAASARERAEIALRQADPPSARVALASFVRYTAHLALRWQTDEFFEGQVQLHADRTWWIQDAGQRWSLDPVHGGLNLTGAALPGLLAVTQDDLLLVAGTRLERQDPTGRTLWSTKMSSLRTKGPRVVIIHGTLGWLGAKSVTWIDTGLGQVGQVARGVEPLSVSPAGVVVRNHAAQGEPHLGLLRPGRNTPIWQVPMPRVDAVVSTVDRVGVLAGETLTILRNYDGRIAGKPWSMGQPARFLGADGRYGVVVLADHTLVLVDILAVEETARIRGPGRPRAMQTTQNGVVVLFETQDVVFFSRDGTVLDRAWVPGSPQAMFAGHSQARGPIVATPRGLVAFSEVSDESGIQRDVDAELALARLDVEAERWEDALRRTTHIALDSAGRVAEAEALRAEVYRQKGSRYHGAMQVALARARAAKNTRKRLGAFSLIGW